MAYQRVTMIDDLPNLDDLEGGGPGSNGPGGYRTMTMPTDRGDNFPNQGGLPPGIGESYQKYLRGSHKPMSKQSGMYAETYDAMQVAPPQILAPPQVMEPMVFADSGPKYDPQQYNCIDIANHIQSCPICSRFYANDRTVYIIAIVVLTIVCLLLLKRVLNV